MTLITILDILGKSHHYYERAERASRNILIFASYSNDSGFKWNIMSEQREQIFFFLNILFFEISISYCKPLFCWHSICCVFGIWYFKISISRRSVKYYVGTIMPFCFFVIYTCLDQKTRNLRFSQASGANVPISHCCVLLNIGFPSYF